MGKKQHSKDTLHVRHTEWVQDFGGKSSRVERTALKRLPFDFCSLSLQPFQTPMCTRDGVVFELKHIAAFLKQYGVSPVTGEKMSRKDLVQLRFQLNTDGKYFCPVTYKVFTPSSHIVAIATSGNVYSKDAVDRLNVAVRNWKDLIDGTEFKRSDIITIQDPLQPEKKDISHFWHIRHKLKVGDPKDSAQSIRVVSQEAKETLAAIGRMRSNAAESSAGEDQQLAGEAPISLRRRADDSVNAAHYSTGAVAASFTSTSMDRHTRMEPARLDDDQVRYPRVKKKGYVRFVTNHGPLNLELDCEYCPKTCENFIRLCRSGYYSGTIFHRSVRHFVLQGGDPTGTGRGGDSAWGGEFKDEIRQHLTHTGRGVLSMANSGPDTNRSQFFITYKSCRHLDKLHAVFGRVVGGLETLDRIEAVEVDKNDRPIEDVQLLSAQVFVDPFEEVDKELEEERAALKATEDQPAAAAAAAAPAATSQPKRTFGTGVGKFLNLKGVAASSGQQPPAKRPKKPKEAKEASQLSDFSAW